MKKNSILIRKIPLFSLIEALSRAYNDGADYVDLSGKLSDDRDDLLILVREDYYYVPDEEEPKKLTDEDLNQLIT